MNQHSSALGGQSFPVKLFQEDREGEPHQRVRSASFLPQAEPQTTEFPWRQYGDGQSASVAPGDGLIRVVGLTCWRARSPRSGESAVQHAREFRPLSEHLSGGGWLSLLHGDHQGPGIIGARGYSALAALPDVGLEENLLSGTR